MCAPPALRDRSAAAANARNPVYLLAVLFAAAGLGCTLAATSLCSYVTREIALAPGQNIEEEVPLTLFENHGVGFFRLEIGNECRSYCHSNAPSRTGCPSFDGNFLSARAFAVITDILGGLGLFFLLCMNCVPVDGKILLGVSVGNFLNVLFEGLTLLILRSDVCNDPDFLSYYFHAFHSLYPDATFPEATSVSCSMSMGSSLAVGAMACWLVAGALSCKLAREI